MRRTPRIPLALAALPVVIATLTLAPVARANDAPRYGDLPTGHLTLMPATKIPAFIAGREKVPGVFVAMPKYGADTPPAGRHVSVVGEQKEADSIRQGNGFGNDDRESGACFTEVESSVRALQGDDSDALEWSTNQQRGVSLWPRSKDNESAGVGAVHSEKLVDGSGQVTLESVDFWVDPLTLGARLISRSSMPLVKVGTALGGLTIYAGRDEREGKARFVQFVVVRRAPPGPMHVGTISATRLDGSSPRGNGCGHVRIPLAIEAKNGDSAIVIAPIEIASVDVTARPAAAPDVKAELADPPSGDEPASRKAKPRLKKRRVTPAPTTVPPNMVEHEIRTRDVQINLSVSQTTRDKEPLLGISFGWASREAVQRIVEEPTPSSGGDGSGD